MEKPRLRILIIDDDEDDAFLVKKLLADVRLTKFQVDWTSTYEEGLEAVCGGSYDACLLDYFLGEQSGLDLLRSIGARGCETPIIVLTGQGGYDMDIEVMHSGAMDYLTKGTMSADGLDRSIRYSIERKRTEKTLRKTLDELETRVRERTADLEAAYRFLQESEERSRMLVESAFDIIYTIAPDMSIRSFNPAFEAITGWSAEEWIGKDYAGLIHPDDLSMSREGLRKTLSGEIRPPAELRILSKSGEYTVVECRTVPHFREGIIVGVIGTGHDVTERKKMEEVLRSTNDILEVRVRERTAELARSNEALRLDDMRLQALLELSQMSAASIRQIADFVVEQQVRLTGSKVGWLGLVSGEETVFTVSACSMSLAHQCGDLPVSYRLKEAGIWTEIIEKGEPVINNGAGFLRTIQVCPNDKQPLHRFMSVPVRDGDRVAAVVLVGNKDEDYNQADVRQLTLLVDGMWKLMKREQAEKALREAESLAAMGRALSSVAHDIKTPLIAIGGFTRLVQKHLDPGSPDHAKLEIVLKETERLERMVKEMLDFSRPLEIQRSTVEVSEFLSETFAVVEEVARVRKVYLKTEIDQHLGPVSLDIMRMKQVLINLIVNAIQASPAGQTVVINVYRSGERFLFDVIDCGCGIPVNNRSEIFSPFFTTKKEGTGLGLAIVKKIVEAHGGHVEVMDNSITGVTFRVSIPITA